jgi:hypothetical protein
MDSDEYECEEHESDSSNGYNLNKIVQETARNNYDFDTESVNSTATSVLDAEFGSQNMPNGAIFERCDYCNSCIRCASVHATLINITEDEKDDYADVDELHFCDICCAKLFHDSVHNVNIDYKHYNKAINDNRVDKYTSDIYKRIGSTPFGALPVYMAAQDNERMDSLSEEDIINNRVVFHNIYKKVVRNIMNY